MAFVTIHGIGASSDQRSKFSLGKPCFLASAGDPCPHQFTQLGVFIVHIATHLCLNPSWPPIWVITATLSERDATVMGKNNAVVHPIRISHPPHTSKHRMAQRDKIEQLLNSLRHKVGTTVCRGTELEKRPPATSWFQQRRVAEKTLARESGNTLLLVDNGWRGEDRPHWILHKNCGNYLYLSLDDVRRWGYQSFCPYCQGAQNLAICGDATWFSAFVHVSSCGNANFLEPQTLNSRFDAYSFYCSIHRVIYSTTADAFIKTAGVTNACPHCEIEAKFGWPFSSK